MAECTVCGRKWFPLQSESVRTYKLPQRVRIPWETAEIAYGNYAAKYGRDQSLERLAERGGFSQGEMDDFFPDWRTHGDELSRERASRQEAERQRDKAIAALRLAEAALAKSRTMPATEKLWSLLRDALTAIRAALPKEGK